MKRHLVTSALPYINGVKHLGNLVGSILPADVYTRYLRQQGEQVLFICGTDEHGTPAEIAAKEAGTTVEQYCEQMFNKQKDIYKRFGIKFDYFGRSSSAENHHMTQEIFKNLEQNDFIVEREIRQIYSIDDERFLPDRYVIGTCPHCNYDKARGDQCELCGRLLETTQLLNPYSAISGSKNLEVRSSNHLFFNLTKLEAKLKTWIETHPDWPKVSKGIATKWLTEGLTERCISRDLKWGVSIPKSGYEHKVFYVWFDAPIAYISMTKEWAKECANDPHAWQEWWSEQSPDTTYTQFMAKDNVPFHAIFFPAMLIGANLNLKLVDYIKAFNWLTYEGGKFSTSSKRGVFLDDALELFPSEYWRYYLMANSPETSDSDFSFSDFASTVNKDLADILGNLVSRVCAMTQKYFEGKIPSLDVPNNTDIVEIHAKIRELLEGMDENIRKLKFREAIKYLRKIWDYGNEYITLKKPWEHAKSNLSLTAHIIANCSFIIYVSAIAASPFIPEISKKIFSFIGSTLNPEEISLNMALDLNRFQPGVITQQTNNLISKINLDEVEPLQAQFAGNQAS